MATDRLSATFSAIADPTRRAILARLASGEATVTELAKPFDALAGQQLPGFGVLVSRALGAALADGVELLVQVGHQAAHRVAVRLCLRRRAVEGRGEDRHQGAMLNLSLRARL